MKTEKTSRTLIELVSIVKRFEEGLIAENELMIELIEFGSRKIKYNLRKIAEARGIDAI